MGLSAQHCQQLAHIGVAGFIVATGAAPMAAAAICGSVAGFGSGIIGGYFSKLKSKDPTNVVAIERVAQKIADDARWASVFSDEHVDMDAVNRACAAVTKYGAIYWPSADVVVRVVGSEGQWPDTVATYVIDEIASHEPSASFLSAEAGNDLEREIALKAAASALEAALSEESYFKTLEPHLMMETLGIIGEVRADVLAIGTDVSKFIHALGTINRELFRLGIIDEKLDALLIAQEAARRANSDSHDKTHQKIDGLADRLANIEAMLAGTLEKADATRLGSALAGERYANPPPVSDELPTGVEPAEEYIREFVELATSQNERERQAAALDAQGKTEESLALLEELAEEESAHAARRWKARGALAFNAFTVKAIDSYERAVGCNPDDADAHNQLGHLYKRLGDLVRAQIAYEHVLALGNQSADEILIAVAYSNLGLIEQTRGNLDGAEAYYKKSLALNDGLGSKEGMAAVYGNLGLVEKTRGNLDGAEAYYKKSLALNDGLGSKEGMAGVYSNLGVIEQIRGNLNGAEAYLKKSLALNEALGRKEGMAAVYGNLGLVEQTRGNLDGAEAYLKKSLALNEALGWKEGMAAVYGNLGLVEKTRGNLDGAEAYHKQSLALNEALGRKEGMAATYGNLGLIEQTRGNLDGAEAYHKKSLALEEALGRKEGMAATYGNLGLIEQTRGNLDGAEVYYKKSLALEEALGRKEGMASQYGNLGNLEQNRGNKNQACLYWRQAYDLFLEIGMPQMVEKVCDMMREADCPDAPLAKE